MRWSVFPDSPGCGEPCLKENVRIYYSKSLQSQGSSFLLFLPPSAQPAVVMGPVWKLSLCKGMDRAPASHSASCSERKAKAICKAQ